MYCDRHTSLLSTFNEAVEIYCGRVARLRKHVWEEDLERFQHLPRDAEDARASCQDAQENLLHHDRLHCCTMLPSSGR